MLYGRECIERRGAKQVNSTALILRRIAKAMCLEGSIPASWFETRGVAALLSMRNWRRNEASAPDGQITSRAVFHGVQRYLQKISFRAYPKSNL